MLNTLPKDLIESIEYIRSINVAACISHDKSLVNHIEKLQLNNCIIQVLPPEIVISNLHLRVALYYTLKAFSEGFNISRKPFIELLLYLLGTRQVREAVRVASDVLRVSSCIVIAIFCRDNTLTKDVIKKIKGRVMNCVKADELDDLISPCLSSEGLSMLYSENLKSHVSLDDISKEAVRRTIKLYLSNT